MSTGLLFIPDISGFTEFVKQTEIKHSKHIIKELLELLLDENKIDLELAEIEGDALFLYKTEIDISAAELLDQIHHMHRSFHRHLLLYKYQRICNCGACTNADALQLKFIVHAAEIEFIEVRDTKKPFGEEVIKVHRLLKNKIPESEYILFTPEYLGQHLDTLSTDLKEKIEYLEESFDFGKYRYGYLKLEAIPPEDSAKEIQSRPVVGRELLNEKLNIAAAPNQVFQLIVDFEKRHLWSPGVDRVDYDENQINQVGSKHVCVIGKNNIEFTSLFTDLSDDELIYIERTKDVPVLKDMSSVYIVKPNGNGALLEACIHTRSNSFVGKMMTPLIKYQLRGGMKKSLAALKNELESDAAA